MGFFKSLGSFFSGATKVATLGIVNPDKGRISVPFSSSAFRTAIGGVGETFTANSRTARKWEESSTVKTIGNIGSTAVYGTVGFLAGGPIGAAIGAGASTQLWNKPPKLSTSLGIGGAVAGAALGVPALASLFSPSPGSRSTPPSDGYSPYPVAAPVNYQDSAQPIASQPPSGLDPTTVLLAGGGLALALLLIKR